MIMKKLYAQNVRLKKLKGFIRESFTAKMELAALDIVQLAEAATKAIIRGNYIQNLN